MLKRLGLSKNVKVNCEKVLKINKLNIPIDIEGFVIGEPFFNPKMVKDINSEGNLPQTILKIIERSKNPKKIMEKIILTGGNIS